ncbi:MAG: hypothetical protein ACLU8W_07210 [Clostridia bacterium]
MGYTAIELTNYTKTYRNKKTGFSVGYYAKSQVKAMYPQGDFKVVGQIGAGVKNHANNTLEFDGKSEPVTSNKQSLIHRTAGYVSCGEDRFVAVKKNIVWLWILILLLVIALIFGARYVYQHRDELFPVSGTVQEETNGSVDQNIVAGDIELTTVKKLETDGLSIACPGITTLHFKAGQTEQEYIFRNPEGNPCYFQFQIILDETGEMIYESDLVPPGYAIAKFNLNRPLEAGAYPATVNYKTYSFDSEQNPLNGSRMKTTIYAE